MSALKDLFEKIGQETIDLIDDEINKQNLIKTGKLKGSVRYKVIINSKFQYRLNFYMVFYGFHLDNGTRNITARKFFQRYIDEQLDKYSGEIADATMSDLIEDL